MPSLKDVVCHIQWAATDSSFPEYGAQYGDGVVETYIAIPNHPQPFTIRVTSTKYIAEGLSVVVFIDGNYQTNRNRVNLLPCGKHQPQERTLIDFTLRQKEKAIGNGQYIGREWRFDDHNIVADLPQGAHENHFEMLGTIEVLILRCQSTNPHQSRLSSPSSASHSQIMESEGDDDPEDADRFTRQRKFPNHPLPVEDDGGMLGGMVGLFDGPSDYPSTGDFQQGDTLDRGYYGRHWQPHDHFHHSHQQDQYATAPEIPFHYGQQHYPLHKQHHQYTAHDATNPCPSHPSSYPAYPTGHHPPREKRVHFDNGSSRRDYSDVPPAYPVPGREDPQETWRNTHAPCYPRAALSHPASPKCYREADPCFECPPGPRTRHCHQHDPDLLRHRDYSDPEYVYGRYAHALPRPPIVPPHPGPQHYVAPRARILSAGPSQPITPYTHLPIPSDERSLSGPFYPAQPTPVHHPPTHPQSWYFPPVIHVAQPPPHTLPGQMPTAPNAPPATVPGLGTIPPPESLDTAKENDNTSAFTQHNMAQDRHDANAGERWSSTDNPPIDHNTANSGDWSNENHANATNPTGDGNWGDTGNNYTNGDAANNDWDKGNDNNGDVNTTNNWQSNEDGNANSGWQNNGNSNTTNGWRNNDQNPSNDTGGQGGGGWEPPDNTQQWSNSGGNNQPNNVPTGDTILAGNRPLYGPHGAYFTAYPTPFEPHAEEEPRYDVPRAVAQAKGLTKQVQPGRGYLYVKKRHSPTYIDTIDEPYARFVFKYRTKEQIKKELGLDLKSEPSPDDDANALRELDKEDLIAMLARAKAALGGIIPSPPAHAASSTSNAPFGQVPVPPPEYDFLRYSIPPGRKPSTAAPGLGISNGNSYNGGTTANNGWSNTTTTTTNNNNSNNQTSTAPQQSWDTEPQNPSTQATGTRGWNDGNTEPQTQDATTPHPPGGYPPMPGNAYAAATGVTGPGGGGGGVGGGGGIFFGEAGVVQGEIPPRPPTPVFTDGGTWAAAPAPKGGW